MYRIHKSIETRRRLMVSLGAGLGAGVEGNEDFTTSGYGVSLRDHKSILELDGYGDCATLLVYKMH